ncbi:hypothetical protein [Rariglobus hedericola]|uniref:Glycoside hydrolase family 42 N-terminal domain-containing protein n=1 Tax=Rariglobus hedericola TaxID=2597822 RepID=A0A556QQW8_9BACT|nr:hypothetical protein [Rariglobus hedericola]TSJ79031.1 hypothetical protein FPL22_06970 [Rariglobus hedericola]
MKSYLSCSLISLLASLIFFTGLTAHAAELVPRSPTRTLTLPASAATVTEGAAWLIPTSRGQSLHFNGAAAVTFDLSPLKLYAGHYRFGLIVRSGVHWINPNGQIPHYRWRVLPASGPPTAPDRFISLDQAPFQPVRESGQPDSWANWYATVQASRMLRLKGNEKLEIANTQDHGGVIELWLQPVSALNAVDLQLKTDAPDNTFTHGTRPTLKLSLAVPEGLPRIDALLALEWLDLLTAKTVVTRSAITLQGGTPQELTLKQDLKPGVYRVRATIESKDRTAIDELAHTAQCLLAYSPARLTADLPDDWPLGAHIDKKLPPMPGFRWFRYFTPWSDIHKAPGVYDWAEFDRVFKSVKDVGGRVMIAYDGSPLWTSARPKAGLPWSASGTANPPDDWDVQRDYLIELIKRTQDERGTLAALELCNEANTVERWQGTPQDMLAMARTFRTAARTSRTPVKIVGLAVSAGHQQKFVEDQINAGLLPLVDEVSGHFYEEVMSPELATPINNLPRHVSLIKDPMHAAGFNLPLLNTETGIDFAARVNGLPPAQDTLNQIHRADPRFNPKEPWLLGSNWTQVSERRAAATYVTGTTQLMGLGVTRSFYFNYFAFTIDDAPSLPWVALGRFGDVIYNVDYKVIQPLEAAYPDSDGKDGSPKALAYILGRPGERQVIVAWGFLSDTSIGRSKHWQRWLDPLPMRVKADVHDAVLSDLYARTTSTINSTGGSLQFTCGEEPVFIEINPAQASTGRVK